MEPKLNSSVLPDSLKPKPNSAVETAPNESGFHGKEKAPVKGQGEPIGVLEVYIHQARDIHNICIYHKQDVYAKIYLTSDPETTLSTQIINGGGKNPVFNENFWLNVRSINDSSLKCEIWMLSRVRNYLQDQLLGFAFVPLSDVLAGNGKLAQEFSLSSSDLFHSPAGFVDLTLNYAGASPEVLEVPIPRSSPALSGEALDAPISSPSELDRIEFPDPKIVNENEMMVSEYFEMPNLDSTNTENLGTTDDDRHLNSEDARVQTEEVQKVEAPPSSVLSVPTTADTAGAFKPMKENAEEAGETEAEASSGSSGLPVLNVKVEAEEKVVQQEIVDMYMKSMQQFTESLAKMKLPLDVENNGPANLKDEKVEASKSNGRSPRVFYGSRAFF
ncbi:hypothetical protein NMG60_11035323 [Bertholletia excelsa]